MKNLRILPIAVIVTAITTLPYQAQAESTTKTQDKKVQIHWGYDGHEGPEHWGELSADYTQCKTGVNQSPVNISHALKSDLPKLVGHYQAGGYEVINNGHAIQVNYKGDSSIIVDDKEYQLKQFHFHHPSENTIDGKSFPLEAHLVHQSADGHLVVVAVMFELGDENSTLQSIWSQLPQKVGEKHQLKTPVNVTGILPDNVLTDYYRFSGSLTTPPCSEGVTWIVAKKYQSVTQAEVDKFNAALKHVNNRPVQPLNSRKVLQ